MAGVPGKFGQVIALMVRRGTDEITLEGSRRCSGLEHWSNPTLAALSVTLVRFNATQVAGSCHGLSHEQDRSGDAGMNDLAPEDGTFGVVSRCCTGSMCWKPERRLPVFV